MNETMWGPRRSSGPVWVTRSPCKRPFSSRLRPRSDRWRGLCLRVECRSEVHRTRIEGAKRKGRRPVKGRERYRPTVCTLDQWNNKCLISKVRVWERTRRVIARTPQKSVGRKCLSCGGKGVTFCSYLSNDPERLSPSPRRRRVSGRRPWRLQLRLDTPLTLRLYYSIITRDVYRDRCCEERGGVVFGGSRLDFS